MNCTVNQCQVYTSTLISVGMMVNPVDDDIKKEVIDRVAIIA